MVRNSHLRLPDMSWGSQRQGGARSGSEDTGLGQGGRGSRSGERDRSAGLASLPPTLPLRAPRHIRRPKMGIVREVSVGGRVGPRACPLPRARSLCSLWIWAPIGRSRPEKAIEPGPGELPGPASSHQINDNFSWPGDEAWRSVRSELTPCTFATAQPAGRCRG